MKTADPIFMEERAHHRGGVRRLLEAAPIYVAFQRFVQPNTRRRAFAAEFIPARPGARILDIGCGTGDILEHLPHDVSYTGYDLNPRYIATAQERYGHRAKFFCADVTAESAPDIDGNGFDLVLAIGLLHHLTGAEARQVCASAHAHLNRGGILFTFDGVFIPGQSRIARWLISRDRGRAVRTPEGYRALVAPYFEDIEEETRTDLLRVPYTHFLMHCRKS